MKKILIALAALAMTGVAANAADMPVKARTYAAPIQMYNWTGFYAGLNAGVGFGGSGSSNAGFVGGGQIGYNWQAGNILFGLEGDFQGTSQKRTDVVGAGILDQKIPYFGTVRGRLGYVAGPWLLYGTAGVGFINNKNTLTVGAASISDNSTKAGFTAGAGVEYMFAPAWSAKLEYLWINNRSNDLTLGAFTTNARRDENVVRVGLNYHF